MSPDVDRKSTPPGSQWPDCPPLQDVYAAARRVFPLLPLGGGSFSYFPELNRKRPPLDGLDFVTHATCPIVHSADDLAVMQTLEALPFITRSTRAFIGDLPYRIGPSTIGMRHNPYGSRTMDNPKGGRIAMAAFDPRQRGLFAAAWMVGYAANVVDAAPEVLTLAALTGPRGVVAESGAVHPAFDAARCLAALAGARRLACTSEHAGAVCGVAARIAGDGTVVRLANLTDRPQSVRLRLPGQPARDARHHGGGFFHQPLRRSSGSLPERQSAGPRPNTACMSRPHGGPARRTRTHVCTRGINRRPLIFARSWSAGVKPRLTRKSAPAASAALNVSAESVSCRRQRLSSGSEPWLAGRIRRFGCAEDDFDIGRPRRARRSG